MGMTNRGRVVDPFSGRDSVVATSLVVWLMLSLISACTSNSDVPVSPSAANNVRSAPSTQTAVYRPMNGDICQTIAAKVSSSISQFGRPAGARYGKQVWCTFVGSEETLDIKYDAEPNAARADRVLNTGASGPGPKIGDRARWFAKVPGPGCELRARKGNAIFSVRLGRIRKYYTADECGRRAPAILQQVIAAVPAG